MQHRAFFIAKNILFVSKIRSYIFARGNTKTEEKTVDRNKRKIRLGKVISNRMDKSIVVEEDINTGGP
jgi:hypothetical protein